MIVLVDTLIPSLADLLHKAWQAEGQAEAPPPVIPSCSSMGHDLNAVMFAVKIFLKACTTEERPIVFFIDDLQWSDDASLQVLNGVLKDKSLKNILFISAYRSNEVDEDHPFSKMMKEVEEVRGRNVIRRMEIFNLSPTSVAEFIADSIDRAPEEVDPIAEAIYTKTLGNIFFVKQALEELVRKNALYYDVMCFQWQFGDVSRVELEQFLSDDVILMVLSKVNTMPHPLPKALALAAYTKNSIDIDLLKALLRAESVEIEPQALMYIIEKAYQEGLVLLDCHRKSFKFAHDRIREAACASISIGIERNKMLLRLSNVLMDRGSPGENDWMLFTAAVHLNSIPVELTDPVEVARLNLRVGKIAVAKGAFTEAVVFFRAANVCLNPNSCWNDHYDLVLELKNYLMETEHFLGNEDSSLALGEDVMQNAKCLTDKTRAQYAYLQSLCAKNNNNYEISIEKGIEVLQMYDIQVPSTPNDGQVKGAKMRLQVALRGRTLFCCSKFPMATDKVFIAQCKIAQIVCNHAFFAKRFNTAVVIGYRMLRLSLMKKAITKDIPYMVVCLGAPCRQKEKYDDASMYANIGISLMERFPGEKSLEFLKAKIAMYSILSSLRLPFRDAIEIFLDLNNGLLNKGETDLGLASGMLAMFCFYHASLPLNSLLEPKLLLFEETASNSGRKTFVVVFSLMRQCLYNLQGCSKSSSRPTELHGEAFQEDAVLEQFEGNPKKMTLRDISIVRLMLAVIFDDEETMDAMLVRLDDYPVHDPPVKRQHFRMAYTSLASHILCRKTNKHKKWADTSMNFFEKLSRFGSPNAQPLTACIKALRKNNVAAFDDAISVCGNDGLLNLTALMNERCGLMLLDEAESNGNTPTNHVEYLKCAIWLYHDWGAAAKVAQLQSRFTFLKTAIQEKPPSQLSSVRRKTALLGVNRKSVTTENLTMEAWSRQRLE